MDISLPRWNRSQVVGFILSVAFASMARAQAPARNWTKSPQFPEKSFTATIAENIRIHVDAPLDDKGEPARATRLIIYALPNGNTLEQTLGCQMKEGLDWHYDIQHVAAQVRMLRSILPDERIVLVCAEAPGLSWPAFRKKDTNANVKIAFLVDKWRKDFGATDAKVLLTGHSGGGGFMFSVIEATKQIPTSIDRIAFLDSNYNFDASTHAEKFERWLKGDDKRRLVVIAYDDREVTLNGKKVVEPTGGTYRATGRMREAFGKSFSLKEKNNPPFQETIGLDGRVHFFVHPNPENKILHTVLVGEMNGLLQAATIGTPNEGKWGTFGGPRAYTKWVQSEPTAAPTAPAQAGKKRDGRPASGRLAFTKLSSPRTKILQAQLPPRPNDAIGGSQFIKSLEGLSLDDREAAILREITRGNFPEFLRNFRSVPIAGSLKKGDSEVHTTLAAMPDYLAVGSDSDFVRIPMTPQTAQQIADRFGCTLPTQKMVDAIDGFADVHLAPHPMTENREAIATFAEHNRLIEQERGKNPLGNLVIGVKKDIVLTPRIFEKPQRLAIYGWRQLDGKPIQPLTIVHWNRYVDYSHGVRLVYDGVEMDGKMLKISDLLADSERCGLVSDEGPMKPSRYPAK